METIKHFCRRVVLATGKDIQNIPDVPAAALLEGQIVAARGGCYVVSRGYPEVDDATGLETYHDFGVVDRGRLR